MIMQQPQPQQQPQDCAHPIAAVSDSALFHMCSVLSLSLVLLLPLSAALSVLICCAQRIHRNTRLLLAVIPAAAVLELSSRVAKLLLFQLLLRQDALQSVEREHLALCVLPSQFAQVFHWTVGAPSLLAHHLLVSLPLALVAEKAFATVFYNAYEQGVKFAWIGPAILGAQLFAALVPLFRSVRAASDGEVAPFGVYNSLGELVCHFCALLVALFLLAVNGRIAARLSGPRSAPTGTVTSGPYSSASCCAVTKMDYSGAGSVTCRYQLRDNRRSLHFCAVLSATMALESTLSALLQLTTTTDAVQNNGTKEQLLLSILAPNALADAQQLLPLFLALVATLLGHESVRHTLLSQLGTHCKQLAERRAKSGRRSVSVALTNASGSSAVVPKAKKRSNFARIVDVQALSDELKNAHFEALQSYWAKNGPGTGQHQQERAQKVKCVGRQEPCSIA